MNDTTKTRIRISQETIAIVTVGLALAALVVTSTGRISDRLDHSVAELRAEGRADRAEARAAREARQAEARAAREARHAEARAARVAMRDDAKAERDAIRDEAKAERDAIRDEARADREAFARQITRLTAGQAHILGLVESLSKNRPAANAGGE